MSDAHGREHIFQFRTHLFAAGVTIDAIEFNEDQSEGYCFKHLEEGTQGLQISDPGIVRARIESDPEGKTNMPVVVIDGRNISWDEFGQIGRAHV